MYLAGFIVLLFVFSIAAFTTNAKFERRFAHIEARLAATGKTTAEASLDEMDALWNEAKGLEG